MSEPPPRWGLYPLTWLSLRQWNVEGWEPLPVGAPHPPPSFGHRRAYFVSKVGNMVYLFSCAAGVKENKLAPKIPGMPCNIFSSLACNPGASTNSEVQEACRATWWGRPRTAWNCEMYNESVSFVNPPHLPRWTHLSVVLRIKWPQCLVHIVREVVTIILGLEEIFLSSRDIC